MSQIFPNVPDLSCDDLAKLADAYELACDELVKKHRYSPNDLSIMQRTMTAELLTFYREGQRDIEALARCATLKALQEMRKSRSFLRIVRGS